MRVGLLEGNIELVGRLLRILPIHEFSALTISVRKSSVGGEAAYRLRNIAAK